jgi:hypothetical protein
VSNIVDSSPLKSGSKLVLLVQRLKGAGKTLSDIATATGWLAHKVRAAMTGPHKCGFLIGTMRSQRAGVSSDRLAKPTRRSK